jgi:hypothetical protein
MTTPSKYYPPRARWYSPLWQWFYVVGRKLHVPEHSSVTKQDFYCLLLGLALPGWSWLWSPKPILGVALGSAYLLLAFVFLAWVGQPISNLAFTLMISIHAAGILRMKSSVKVWKRILLSVVVFVAVAQCLYVPLRNAMERHWFAPLQFNGKTIVVLMNQESSNVTRGSWVVYSLESSRQNATNVTNSYGYGAVIVEGGNTLGRILAVGGDEVVFESHRILVNGRPQQRRDTMPVEGSIAVTHGRVFVWPEMNVRMTTGMGAAVQPTLLRLAVVPETVIVGKPFDRWFWREQKLP